jgi:alkanesulfonate monooxygenase SsuD/methylene tetrahydromethanopterin reductase-like flavin-dependent oxidoreductase (luciferase family)
MRFGLGPVAAAPEDEAEADTLARNIAQLSQEEGFDSLWVEPGRQLGGASPIVVAAVLARVASAGTIVARPLVGLGHPISIAEEAATFDIIARGRTVLAPCDRPGGLSLSAYGVPAEEAAGRFWESVDILQRCWAPEEFSFDGAYWRIPANMPEHADRPPLLSVTPKPSQPMIPLWIGATSERSVAMAAQRGLPVLAEAWETRDEIAAKFSRHRAEGAVASARLIRPAIRDVVVEESAALAWSAAEAVLARRYAHIRANGWPVPEAETRAVAADRAIVGDVEEVLTELRAYAEAGVNYLVCRVAAPDSAHESVRRTAVLLGRAVAPHLRMYGLSPDIRVSSLAEADDPVLPVLKGTF